MRLTGILAIGLAVFLARANLAISQQRPVPPKPPETHAGKTDRAVQPIPSVSDLARQLACTVDFFDVDGHPAFLIRPKGKVLLRQCPGFGMPRSSATRTPVMPGC